MELLKDVLLRIKSSDIEIKSLINLKNSMRENVLSINSSISEKVSGSKNLDGVYDTVDRYLDLEEVINNKLEVLLEDKKVALGMINNLKDSMSRIILIEHYFNNKSWNDIAFRFGKSKAWVKNVYLRILKEL